MVADHQLAEARDPDGHSVVLLARIWHEKITRDHPEVREHLAEVLDAVTRPDHVEKDPRGARRRYYRKESGPSRWLLVVVSFEQQPGRIMTALAMRKDPQAMEAVNVRIGPLVFDHSDYDAEGDVLYLHIGSPQNGDGEETPEGHVLRFEPATHRVIGLTVINARWLLERDGRLVVTVPEKVEASAEELAAALAAA